MCALYGDDPPTECITFLFSIIFHYIAHDAIFLSEGSIHDSASYDGIIAILSMFLCEFFEIYVCTYSERPHLSALKIDQEAEIIMAVAITFR